MRRYRLSAGLAALVLAALAAGPARGRTPIEMGAALGLDLPFQDDAVSASAYALRARAGGPIYAFEPSLNWFGGGDFVDITSLMFNGVMAGRVDWLYWTGGLGWSWVDLEGRRDSKGAITYDFGAGITYPLGSVMIDVSPRFFLVNTPGDGHREHLLMTVGLSYLIR